MRYIKILVSLFFATIFFISCSKEDLKNTATVISDTSIFDKEHITVGTFNLEWLGDGHRDRKKRTQRDYANIARIIEEIDADILGLQEIENQMALKKLLKYLPDYGFIIGTTGGAQKLAILYKKSLTIYS